MKGSNKKDANPRHEFPGPYKQETSNLVKGSTGKAFSAKKDSKKGK